MSVTVVSCVYGDYDRFLPGWLAAVRQLDPAPDDVIVATDKQGCDWEHPQAFYLNDALSKVETEWAWMLDIDDVPFADALAGLDEVVADVWQMGFERSDGEIYVPPQLTNAEYLASTHNVYVGTSAVRLDAFRAVGGYRDVALQDWSLWRLLAASGATFQSSGRTHFRYQRHPETRGATELTTSNRPMHLAEMFESENLVAV